MRKLMWLATSVAVVGMATPAPVLAQRVRRARAPRHVVSRPVRMAGARVAILPWTYLDGSRQAVRAAGDFLYDAVERSGFDITRAPAAQPAWYREIESDMVERNLALPSVAHLAAIGKVLDVRYVITGRAAWHYCQTFDRDEKPVTRWMCTVDLIVVDAQRGKAVCDARGVRATGLEDASALIDVAPVFRGGRIPAPPNACDRLAVERRAGVVAIARALRPWLAGAERGERRLRR